MAFDIYPIQITVFNPNDNAKIAPACGAIYLDRKQDFPGKAEDIIDIFAANGFTIWGGNWQNPIDYHHFQLPRDMAQQLVKLSYEQG